DLGKLKIAVREDGSVKSLSGIYVNSEGSGLFETRVPTIQVQKPIEPAPIQIAVETVTPPTPIQPTPPKTQAINVLDTPVISDKIPNESDCDTSIRQISNALTTYSSYISNQKLPWMNLSWLNASL